MSNRTRARSLRGQHGQTMTEFAVILPVFALLLFAVIQFGFLFHNYITLTDAVRAGARKAAVARNLDDPVGETKAAVRRSASDLDQSKLVPDVVSSWEPGSDATVSATYPYEIDLLGFVVASGDLRSETTERVE